MRQRSVILAAGFPLAALPQVFPRAMVHAAIAAEAAGEQRRRSLPAPLVVYLNLALAARPEHGTEEVLAELLAALPNRTRAGWRHASSTSITAARRRLGPAVMHRLFTQVATSTSARQRAVATLAVPASPDNRAAFTPDTPGRPHLHLTALVTPTGALNTATWTPCRYGRENPAIAELHAASADMCLGGTPRHTAAAASARRSGATLQRPGTALTAAASSPQPDAEQVRAVIPLELLPWAPVVRSRHADGVIAEVWSALCLHQAAMALGLGR